MFKRHPVRWGSFWGALATASGVWALFFNDAPIPLLAGWLQAHRIPPDAVYWVAIAVSMGMLAVIIYQQHTLRRTTHPGTSVPGTKRPATPPAAISSNPVVALRVATMAQKPVAQSIAKHLNDTGWSAVVLTRPDQTRRAAPPPGLEVKGGDASLVSRLAGILKAQGHKDVRVIVGELSKGSGWNPEIEVYVGPTAADRP